MRLLMVTAMLICGSTLLAGDRFEVVPSLQLNSVHDDNLNSSIEDPLGDRINRVTPGLALRLDSPRLRILGSCSLDSERYMKHSNFDSDRARERAEIGMAYEATRRLTLAVNSSYVDTNTLADLNSDTGLAASRARGRRLSFTPSATFRLSPRVTAAVSASSSATNVVNGIGTRILNEDARVDRQATARDRFSVAYTHSRLMFSGSTTQTIDTHVMVGEWIHNFSLHDRLMLQAGPRVTGNARSLDMAASLTHTYRIASIGLTYAHTQATVIGYAGAVDMQSLQGHFSLDPNRRLSLYINPAILRSSQSELQGTVTRTAIGARWAITSLLDADLAYNHDLQNGAIDTLRPNAQLTHSTLSIGLRARAR